MHKSIRVLQGLSRSLGSGLLLCGLLLVNVGVGFAQEAAIEVDQTQQQEIDRLIQELRHEFSPSTLSRIWKGFLSFTITSSSITRESQCSSSSWVQRSSAADALVEIGTEEAVNGLIEELQDSDAELRCSVVNALGRIGTETAVSGLIQALQDQSIKVPRELSQYGRTTFSLCSR